MKVLLTGARGNLGRAIAAQDEFRIVGLNREDWASIDSLFAGTAGSSADGNPVDALIHGAYDLFCPVAMSPVEYFESNLMATARLLAAAARHKVRAFYYVSSAAVYGEDLPPGQGVPTRPATIYGMTKRLNEELVRSFCSREGLAFGSFRVFNLYGGADRFSVIHHLDLAIQGVKPFVMNNGGLDCRDFIHVNDAARAIVSIVRRGSSVGEIDVGTGQSIRISEIVDVVRGLVPGLPVASSPGHGKIAISRADPTRIREFLVGDFVNLPAWLAVRYRGVAQVAAGLRRPA